MEEIEIHSPVIQLDQLLKWAGIVETGGQVKPLLEEGMIKLNGVIVSEKRKKIKPGDVIEIEGVGGWKVTGPE